jgi:arylsulfatase A-like enzyme
MKNKSKMFAYLVFFLVLYTSCENSKPQPNIILILTDDQGWTDSSVPMIKDREDSKSDFYETPNLERFAKDGLVFSSAYAPAPVCTPTRYSILYGKTPAKLRHATLKNWNATPPENETSIPKMIKSANSKYKTAHFGKWHQSLTPSDVGYDESDGPTGNGEGDWIKPGIQKNPDSDPKRTFGISNRACEFISESVSKDNPFFMQVSYYAVHVQNYGLESTKEKYRNKKPGKKSTPRDFEFPAPPLNQGMISYAAMVEDLDTGFGMILDKLDELGITENTYVIFTSDNGGGFRGNQPLKMGKADLWEGGIRVPTVVRGPKVLSGKYCDIPIVGWDFLPTISDIIGNENKLSSDFDGGSLLSVFEKGNAGTVQRNTEELIFHFPWFNGEPESAVRLGDFKLIKNLDSRKSWLFNVVNDIEESNDLSEALPDQKIKMEEILTNYLKDNNAETVMDLRKIRRSEMVENNIPDARKKIIRLERELISLKGEEKEVIKKELEKEKRYLKWLKGEVIFTDERSKLHL